MPFFYLRRGFKLGLLREGERKEHRPEGNRGNPGKLSQPPAADTTFMCDFSNSAVCVCVCFSLCCFPQLYIKHKHTHLLICDTFSVSIHETCVVVREVHKLSWAESSREMKTSTFPKNWNHSTHKQKHIGKTIRFSSDFSAVWAPGQQCGVCLWKTASGFIVVVVVWLKPGWVVCAKRWRGEFFRGW